MPNSDKIRSGDEEGDDRIPAQRMPDDEKLPCDEKGDDRITPQIYTDDDNILFDDEEGDDPFSPQRITDDVLVLSGEKRIGDIIPQNHKISYSEIFSFQKAGGILLLNKMYYNVSIFVRLMDNEIHTINCIFNTSAGPNLTREDKRYS